MLLLHIQEHLGRLGLDVTLTPQQPGPVRVVHLVQMTHGLGPFRVRQLAPVLVASRFVLLFVVKMGGFG